MSGRPGVWMDAHVIAHVSKNLAVIAYVVTHALHAIDAWHVRTCMHFCMHGKQTAR